MSKGLIISDDCGDNDGNDDKDGGGRCGDSG